jgi:UrcA family protein
MATSDIRTPVWSLAVIAAMFCGALVFSHAAMAQPGAGAAPAESQAITVTAPEVERKVTGKTGVRRYEVVVLSASSNVSYADLDLSKPADAAQLKKRIQDAARDDCRRIDQSSPTGKVYSPPPGCAANAAREPLAIAEQLTRAAQAH